MKTQNRPKWWKSLLWNVVANVIATTIVVSIGYYAATQTVETMIGKGVALLDIQSTSEDLDNIVKSCQEATTLLGTRESRPASSMIIDIRKRFQIFSVQLDALSATVPLVDNYMEYARYDPNGFVKAYGQDIKTWREAHFSLESSLAAIDETLQSLDQQLFQEPTVDVDKIRAQISEIHRWASSSQRSLVSSQSAILNTLKSVGDN